MDYGMLNKNTFKPEYMDQYGRQYSRVKNIDYDLFIDLFDSIDGMMFNIKKFGYRTEEDLMNDDDEDAENRFNYPKIGSIVQLSRILRRKNRNSRKRKIDGEIEQYKVTDLYENTKKSKTIARIVLKPFH